MKYELFGLYFYLLFLISGCSDNHLDHDKKNWDDLSLCNSGYLKIDDNSNNDNLSWNIETQIGDLIQIKNKDALMELNQFAQYYSNDKFYLIQEDITKEREFSINTNFHLNDEKKSSILETYGLKVLNFERDLFRLYFESNNKEVVVIIFGVKDQMDIIFKRNVKLINSFINDKSNCIEGE